MKIGDRRGCLHRVTSEETHAASDVGPSRTVRRCAHCRALVPFGPAASPEPYNVMVERMAADIALRWMDLTIDTQWTLIRHAPGWSMPCEQLAARILEHHRMPS